MDAVLQALADPSRRTVLEILRDIPRRPASSPRRCRSRGRASRGTCGCSARPARSTYERDAQRRIYSLRPEPLADVDAWLADYRALWQRRLDALHTEIAREEEPLMNPTGTMRALDERRGAIRVDDTYGTDLEDLDGSLSGRSSTWKERWTELRPAYGAVPVRGR